MLSRARLPRGISGTDEHEQHQKLLRYLVRSLKRLSFSVPENVKGGDLDRVEPDGVPVRLQVCVGFFRLIAVSEFATITQHQRNSWVVPTKTPSEM